MFELERYLIIANIILCIILAGGLAFYQRQLDGKQTIILTQQLALAQQHSSQSHGIIADKLTDIEKHQTALIATVVDVQNTISSNYMNGQADTINLLSQLNQVNSNLNSLTDKIKRLPRPGSCYYLN